MNAKEWLQKAKREKFAIGAFNVGNLETFKAIVLAAVSKKSPVIIESSPGETSWMGAENIVDLARNFSQEYNIPVFINLDHATTLEECIKGIEAGFDMIHFDGSKLPLEENIETVKKVVELARPKGIIVEGEMDYVVGSSEVHFGSAETEIAKGKFTDPAMAQKFVEKSGIDILAIFIGNVHGIFTEGGEKLQLPILTSLAAILPNTFFSLHGGSGISETDIEEAIARGIVKININTEMRQAFKNKLEEELANKPNEYALYKLEEPVVKEVQKVVEQKIEGFGSKDMI